MLHHQSIGLNVGVRGLLLACATVLLSATAQAASNAPEFPQDPAQWIHGRPIEVEKLKGKAVFIWYFESKCPVCRSKWPGILELAKKYDGQPIIFMAVSSGTRRPEIEQYVRETQVPWPVLVDSNRDFESRSGINPIVSLKNIHQLKLITPEGNLVTGDWSKMEADINAVLKTAKWKVDPKGVPPALRDAWMAVEFGNYAAGGSAIKRGLQSHAPEVKNASEKLKAVVQAEIDALQATAKADQDKGDLWGAYNALTALTQQFSAYGLSPQIEETKRTLAADPKMKAGVLAQHEVDNAKKLLSSGSTVNQKRAVQMLEKAVKDSPESNAGKEAEALLAQINNKS